MGFQSVVKNQPGVAAAGDFYGNNPRAVVLAGAGQFVAPSGGLRVGSFCWADTVTGAVSQSYVPGWQLGFLHREGTTNTVIVAFLGDDSYQVLQGFPVNLFSQGDFWAKFAGGATPGQKVYADPGTGAPVAASSAPATATATASAGASFTGVIAANVLTTSAQTGYITTGDVLVGAGVTVGTLIGAQLTGPAGGAGTYTVVHANVASEAMTTTSTVLNVTAILTGALAVGDDITGAGVTAAQITAQLSGAAGGIGQYTISVAQTFAPTTVSVGAIATPWFVDSVAANGEHAVISSWG